MAFAPDLQGFRGAMDRLRTNFGQDVPFFIPVAKTWPPDTQIDPETGEPYDPAIEPLTDGYTTVTKHVGVVTKPISPAREGNDIRFAPGGEFSDMDAILDLEDQDYVDVADAVEVELYGKRFKIMEMNPSGLGGDSNADRFVVYLEAK